MKSYTRGIRALSRKLHLQQWDAFDYPSNATPAFFQSADICSVSITYYRVSGSFLLSGQKPHKNQLKEGLVWLSLRDHSIAVEKALTVGVKATVTKS